MLPEYLNSFFKVEELVLQRIAEEAILEVLIAAKEVVARMMEAKQPMQEEGMEEAAKELVVDLLAASQTEG